METPEVITSGVLLAIYVCIILTGVINKLPLSEEINDNLPDKVAISEDPTQEELEDNDKWVSNYYGVLWIITILPLLYIIFSSKEKYEIISLVIISLLGSFMGIFSKYGPVLGAMDELPMSYLSDSVKVSLVHVILGSIALINFGFYSGALKYDKTTLLGIVIAIISILIGWALRYYYVGKYALNQDELQNTLNATNSKLDAVNLDLDHANNTIKMYDNNLVSCNSNLGVLGSILKKTEDESIELQPEQTTQSPTEPDTTPGPEEVIPESSTPETFKPWMRKNGYASF